MQFSRISAKPSLDLSFQKWLIINDESINRAEAGMKKSKQMQGFATIGGSSKIHFAVGDPYADFQKDKPGVAEARRWLGGSSGSGTADFRSASQPSIGMASETTMTPSAASGRGNSRRGDRSGNPADFAAPRQETSARAGESSRPSTQQPPPRTRPVVPPLRAGGLMGLQQQQQQQQPAAHIAFEAPPPSSTAATSSRPGSRAAAALGRMASAGELGGRRDPRDDGRRLSSSGSQTLTGVRIPPANASVPAATSSYWKSYSGCRRGTTLTLG